MHHVIMAVWVSLLTLQTALLIRTLLSEDCRNMYEVLGIKMPLEVTLMIDWSIVIIELVAWAYKSFPFPMVRRSQFYILITIPAFIVARIGLMRTPHKAPSYNNLEEDYSGANFNLADPDTAERLKQGHSILSWFFMFSMMPFTLIILQIV